MTMYLKNRQTGGYSQSSWNTVPTFLHTHKHKHKHPLVESFPKAQEYGSVQVAPVAAELQDGHVPLLNIGVCLSFVVLQVKGPNWSGTQINDL